MGDGTALGRWRRGLVSAVVGAAVLTACAPVEPAAPSPSPSQTVWAFGDSQAGPITGRGPGWGDRLGPAVFNAAWDSYGAGFVVPGDLTGRTVAEEAAWWLERYPAPERFVVVAGVNDLGNGASVADMLAGVAELEAVAASAGVEVLYVGYPPFVHSPYLEPHLAERLAFNDQLAQLVGDRFRSCDEPLLDAGGTWLDEAFRLDPADAVHLGDDGLTELAACMAEAYGEPFEALV